MYTYLHVQYMEIEHKFLWKLMYQLRTDQFIFCYCGIDFWINNVSDVSGFESYFSFIAFTLCFQGNVINAPFIVPAIMTTFWIAETESALHINRLDKCPLLFIIGFKLQYKRSEIWFTFYALYVMSLVWSDVFVSHNE